MTDKANDKDKLLNDAIKASIEFEEWMDKTDFDSWLEEEETKYEKILKEKEEYTFFENYINNKNTLRRICDQMKKIGIDEIPKKYNKSHVVRYFIKQLFLSKFKRLEARISSDEKRETEKYDAALFHLFSATNALNKLKIEEAKSEKEDDKKWLIPWSILFFNDLSICYAGLENSSLSRGYAKEARELIEDDNDDCGYSDFKSIIADTNNNTISNHKFVASKHYDLYIIALYNQAEAERRSNRKRESEKNFKEIIKFAERWENFNYYPALLNLSVLYIEEGRGNEAIQLLDKIITPEDRNKEDDIRCWKASLEKIHALIEQSEYDNNERIVDLFKNFIKIENNLISQRKRHEEKNTCFSLKERHKITHAGFKALKYLVSLYIEKGNSKKPISGIITQEYRNELKVSIKTIDANIVNLRERKQKGLEQASYKHLSEIHLLLKEKEKAERNIVKYLSIEENDEIKNLDDILVYKSRKRLINDCKDSSVLENFSKLIIDKFDKTDSEKEEKKLKGILEEIKSKIIELSEERDEPFRAVTILRWIEEKLDSSLCPLGKSDYDEKSLLLFNTEKDELDVKKYLNGLTKNKLKEICKENGWYVYGIKNDIIDKIIKSTRENSGFSKEDIRTRLDTNEKEFDSILYGRKEMPSEHLVELINLRRWNSFSPGLSRRYNETLGGGYLLRIRNGDENKCENIVIDPGYNFIQNLCGEDFHIEDIDTIIVTHSHLDHCSELLPIMDLIYQINKRNDKLKDGDPQKRKTPKKVNLCLSRGAYNKFSTYITDWQKQLNDVIVIVNLAGLEWEVFEGLTIEAKVTHHKDLGGMKGIGLIIKITEREFENDEIKVGFTSDTPWYENINEDFKECNLLCVHLGSIKYQEIGYTDDPYNSDDGDRKTSKKSNEFKEFKKTFVKSNHLLFFGTEDIVSYYNREKKDALIIVGEFGEELKYGLRVDLCKKLSMGKSVNCLPGDIGQYIVIEKDGTKKVRCDFCEEFVKPDKIKTFSYGREDAIQYICQTCDNTLSELQKHAIIKHRLTRH
jgi:hypothetical protein